MNRIQYLKHTHVQDFIQWLHLKNEPGSFMHNYMSLKPKQNWRCNSIYNAYQNYNWRFSFTDPTTLTRVNCTTFDQSTEYLNKVSTELRNSVLKNDQLMTENKCNEILAWGGVRKDRDKTINTLKNAQQSLDPQIFDTSHNTYGIPMNSGYSKIYSCLIDDFIIYDSRVGAALGLLVRRFCEESGLTYVPESLLFAFSNARLAKKHIGQIRNPGNEFYSFPNLNCNTSLYIQNNMKANWLVKAVTNHPENEFSQLEASKRMRAFESALFMVGYKVN